MTFPLSAAVLWLYDARLRSPDPSLRGHCITDIERLFASSPAQSRFHGSLNEIDGRLAVVNGNGALMAGRISQVSRCAYNEKPLYAQTAAAAVGILQYKMKGVASECFGYNSIVHMVEVGAMYIIRSWSRHDDWVPTDRFCLPLVFQTWRSITTEFC